MCFNNYVPNLFSKHKEAAITHCDKNYFHDAVTYTPHVNILSIEEILHNATFVFMYANVCNLISLYT